MAHRTMVFVLAFAIATTAALASAHDAQPSGDSRAVFQTIDEAAAHAVQVARDHEGLASFERGGTIFRTEGGFGFALAEQADPASFRVSLGTSDVAWFYARKAETPGLQSIVDRRLSEAPSTQDRQAVDRLDPLHRSVYVLTSSDKLIAYRGNGVVSLTLRAWPGLSSNLTDAISRRAASGRSFSGRRMDRLKVLELIGKHIDVSAFRENVSHRVNDDLLERMESARRRVAQR